MFQTPHGLLNNDEAKLAVEVDTGVEITTASRGLLKYKAPGPMVPGTFYLNYWQWWEKM